MNYWIIYVLKLENDCWYVGRTTHRAFKERMKNHWNGKATWFTAENKPTRIYDIEVYDRALTSPEAEAYENKKTLQLAQLRGYSNVRGGGFTQREPSWPTNTQTTFLDSSAL